MKFTLSWLKDHLDTDASPAEIGRKLTELGLELEGIENPADKLAPVRIAHVVEAVPHPNADKLRVCQVDTGNGQSVQVVCGAPNARAGMKVAYAPPGAHIPGSGITLKVAAIRGVESHGMLCSARELELGEDHDGILDLPADAPPGAPFAAWIGLDDPVFDIAITPDRADCLGVAGIARDLAAAGLGTLKTPAAPSIAGDFACPIAVHTHDPDGCPAFLGRVVRGVRNGPSPDWLQRRLKAIGLRPISVLVDVTQYLMIDRARPLHVYDLARLTGAVTARRGRSGDSFEALNGKTYAPSEAMVVIADDARVLGLGGIMGGEYSGCTEATTDVLIECALFESVRVGETGRALNLNSDARARFERGVDPAGLDDGLALATAMILDLCGGTPSESMLAGASPRFERTIAYRPARTLALGGLAVPAADQRAILERLGFTVSADDEPWTVRVPSWRKDVEGEADLVEEVLRLVGYDHIPSAPMPRADGVAKPTATPVQARLKRVRRTMAARGFAEAITWSFIAPEDAAPFGGGAWTLDNPISADLAVMRPTLLAGLARAAQRNRDRGADSVRLFELGKRYHAMDDGFERLTLALLAAGDKQGRHWTAPKASRFDVFDAKAEALAALEAAGFAAERAQVTMDAPGWFHPGRSGVLRLGPTQPLAAFGELHPTILKAFDLDGTVIAAEVYLDAIPLPKASGRARPVYTPPVLQAVTRDFAFVVPADLPSAKLIQAIRGADKQTIIDVSLFDRFAGPGVEDGHVSLAVAVTLQPKDTSFTDADLTALSAKIVDAAAKATGARLRA